MKLISLNVWGGKILNPLLNFIDEEAKNTDIFCFQEILDSTASMGEDKEERHHLLKILKQQLSEFHHYFSPMQDGIDCGAMVDSRISFGLAIFVRKSVKIESFDSIFIYGERNGMVGGNLKTLSNNAQFLTFLDEGGKSITIANVHGISEWPKTDTPARIKQSEIINEFLNRQNTSEIICGDFNLFPDTESVKILERGRRNLIREFKIENTRTSHVPNPHVSDYCFVSQDIMGADLSVPNVEISDHLPLVLTFLGSN